MPRTGRELAIVVIVATMALITGLLAHQYFGHGSTAPDESLRIEERDEAAVGAAVAAGQAAERQEAATLGAETDDQVLADASPAVQAAVDKAIQDHEWEHHR